MIEIYGADFIGARDPVGSIHYAKSRLTESALTVEKLQCRKWKRYFINEGGERIGIVLDVTECEHRPEAGASYAS